MKAKKATWDKFVQELAQDPKKTYVGGIAAIENPTDEITQKLNGKYIYTFELIESIIREQYETKVEELVTSRIEEYQSVANMDFTELDNKMAKAIGIPLGVNNYVKLLLSELITNKKIELETLKYLKMTDEIFKELVILIPDAFEFGDGNFLVNLPDNTEKVWQAINQEISKSQIKNQLANMI